jgi:ubiquinone/menaquinone biosynthesis C-methylase UbiE
LATVQENQEVWSDSYDWSRGGTEWSTWWGGVDSQWLMTVLPRIRAFVPAPSILEIGPGFGRWTQYLSGLSSHLTVVDISPRCLEACRTRFGADHISYIQNDGESLPLVDDESIDFVFTFDSLVHAEEQAIRGYLRELNRILTQDGAAFIHHSNLGTYSRWPWRLGKLPVIRRPLIALGIAEESDHWRARSVTARRFREWASSLGLSCTTQELVNWGTSRLIDCLSVVVRRGSRWDRSPALVRNPRFMAEAAAARFIASIYGGVTHKPHSIVTRP